MLAAGLFVLLAAAGVAWSTGLLGESQAVRENTSAVTLSSNRLDFGSVPVNAHATRKLILLNQGEKPIRARIELDARRFAIDPEQLILHPGVAAHVTVALVAGRLGAVEDEIQVVLEGEPSPLVVAVEASVEEQAADTPYAGDPAAVAARSEGGSRARGGASVAPVAEFGARPRGGEATSGFAAPGGTAIAQVSTGEASEHGAVPAAEITSRQTTPDGAAERAFEGAQGARGVPPGAGVNVQPYDPATAAPFRSVAEDPALAEATADDTAKQALELPTRTGDELPETLPEEPGADDDIFDDDDEPVLGPSLTISGSSTVRIMGSVATFYPQRLNVAGADLGGALSIADAVQFPTVPLAFGESMLFAQAGSALPGSWDPASGQVYFELPLQAVDADGDAAPIKLRLTTGTAMARNEAGIVVSITGTPRVADTGILRLVAVEKIPVGFKNGGEERLAVFEILANLTFGDVNGPSGPGKNGFGRIGG
jgi:hypothetical protein